MGENSPTLVTLMSGIMLQTVGNAVKDHSCRHWGDTRKTDLQL
jgi:hypothetical protein